MEYLQNLNPNQLQAVTTTSKKVLVVAGAGSGKTRVLTERIKYLLDNGVDPREIASFTFTKRAALEMKYRLKGYDFDNIYTFHSFCYDIIKNNKDELGFQKFNKIHVVDEDFEERIILDILSELKLNYNHKLIKDYISKRKNNIEYKFKDTAEAALFNKIYFKFQEYLMTRGFIDYDDMISLVVNNLDNLSIKEDILDSCKYILVDECQDTNQIQYELIKKLSSKYNNLFFVGDDDQKIYSFRTSDNDVMNSFKNSCDEVIILNQNYRCASNILDKANKLISFNKNRDNKQLFSEILPKYKIKYDDYLDTKQEADFVASKIERLINMGYKPNEIAVLFRNNYESLQIEYALKSRNIPFTLYGRPKFYKHDEIKRMISIYRLINNPDDYISFREDIPIDQAIYTKLMEEYRLSKLKFIDFLISSQYENLKDYAIKIKGIIEKRDLFNKSTLFDTLVKLLFKTQTGKCYNNLIEFKDLIVNNELEHEIDIINELMLNDSINKNEMGVNLLTIHKAKGLEFKCVFIISINDGILPSTIENNNLLQEERRVLYVGITRAKEYLYLSSSEYHFINGMKKRLRPSLFLSELR